MLAGLQVYIKTKIIINALLLQVSEGLVSAIFISLIWEKMISESTRVDTTESAWSKEVLLVFKL